MHTLAYLQFHNQLTDSEKGCTRIDREDRHRYYLNTLEQQAVGIELQLQ